MRKLTLTRPGLAGGCAGLMALLLLAGGLLWYRPALTTPGASVAQVPAPPALFAADRFSLPPHEEACEGLVTVTPESQIADFQLFPTRRDKTGGPPVAFDLSGPGYQMRTVLRAGYPGGEAALPISPPPRHSLIATACFTNLGSRSVQLVGTDEPRTVSRSYPVSIAGRAVPGDVALSFTERDERSILNRLGDLADHASNLTDGFLPPVLVWIVGILAALGVPAAMILAVWTALSDDAATPAP